MRISRTSALLLCVLLVAPVVLMNAPPAAGQSDPINVLTLDLGTLEGGSQSFAKDISPSGLVVGNAQNTAGARRPFAYQLPDGPMTELPTLESATENEVLGVTDAGVVIGYASNYEVGLFEVFAVDATAEPPTMTTLPLPAEAGSNPWLWPEAMNRDGSVVGWWGDDTDDDVDYRAFVYDPASDQTTNLGYFGNVWTFGDVAASAAVGYKEHGDSFTGFVQPLDASARIDLNDEFSWEESYAYGINDAGVVVGQARVGEDTSGNENWFSFAWDQSNDPVVLPEREGLSNWPTFVNEDWIIVREVWPGNTAVYDLTDLSAEPVPLEQLLIARALSDEGVVVGNEAGTADPHAIAYDLNVDPPQPIELPTPDGISSSAYAVAEVDGHTVVVGDVEQSAGTRQFTAGAWVLGVPDTPTIALVADSDGIDPVDGVTADATPTLTGTTDQDGQVVIRRDGSEVATITADATTGAWSYTSPDLTDGTYEFTATLEPTTGWPSSPATVIVTIEVVPPPTVTVGTAKVTGPNVTVPFTIDGTYDPASLTCQLDDATPVPCASDTEHTFTEVAQGDHVATVQAATPTGRTGQDSTTFTVKAARFAEPDPPPSVLTVTITDVTAAKNGPITVDFSADGGTDPYTYTCTLVGGTTELTVDGCESPWVYPDDGSWLAGGNYEVSITALDGAETPVEHTATARVNVPGPKTQR